MIGLEFKQLSDKDLPYYDLLVEQSREGTIFHKSWWFNSFKTDNSLNANNVIIYGAFENGNLVAGFPVPYREMLFIKFIINPKVTPYLGTVFENKIYDKNYKKYSYMKNINQGFVKILDKQGICLCYPFNLDSFDMQPFIWSNYGISICYTYLLKLNDLNKIWANMDKKRRNDITRCCKYDHRISTSDLDVFIKLHGNSLRRQRHKTIPDDIWRNIYRECRRHDSCEIFTLFRNDEPKASLFLVWDNKRSYYIGGGFNDNSNGDMALLIWEAIKYTKEDLNLNEFDFEGSMVPSIEQFFRKFGGEIRSWYILKHRLLVSFS